jgi:hypothetical protein
MVGIGTRRRLGILTAVLWAAVACSGGNASPDAGLDGGDTDTGDPVPLTAVDMLIVVDDSEDAAAEQQLLRSGLHALVGALVAPPDGSPYAAIDDLRVAAVTSNMGLSSDGVNNDEYWPDYVPYLCEGFGDDGRFQGIDVAAVDLLDGGVVECPDLDDGAWIATTPTAPDAELAAAAACVACRGTNGCGWEQEFASMWRALSREDQAAFVRANALLAVIVVGEEDDCALADGQAMFATEEVADLSAGMVNIACGQHPELLVPPAVMRDRLVELKGGADRVVYAAFAGAPYGDQPGAAACPGPGAAIADCLEQEAMQIVPEQPYGDLWLNRLACTRSVGETQVTYGEPGRRLIEVAIRLGANGYVYSICNADWTPAFDALAAMIAGKIVTE